MYTGTIIKTTGSWHTAKISDGTIFQCKVKGKLRIKGLVTTNPIAVGDVVDFEIIENTGLIYHIHERKNYIIRKSTKLSKQAHIIAANMDMACLVVTLVLPETSTMFIDRYLISAEAYRIPVMLIFNKTDIYDNSDLEYLNALMFMYKHIGYHCMDCSAKTGLNIEEVKEFISGKTVVFSGHSGVGKSTLLNAIDGNLNIKTNEISEMHQSGKHTTTFSEMYALGNNTYIVDTPGIKGFGIIDMEKEEIFHFFPEIFKASSNCKYYNCTHMHEPDCAVKEAVDNHQISLSRYQNYVSIMEDDLDEKYRKPF